MDKPLNLFYKRNYSARGLKKGFVILRLALL